MVEFNPTARRPAETFKPAVDPEDLKSDNQQVEQDKVEANPWGTFGSLGAKEVKGKPTMPKAMVSAPKVASAEREDKLAARKAMQERKEAITEAHLDVTFDQTAIANILTNDPDLLPKERTSFISQEEQDQEYEERRADLQKTLDAISHLPEKLHFEPGITLVVGENGMGKSTLARALNFAAMIQQRMDEGFGDGSYESAAKILDPQYHKGTRGGSAPAFGGLAPLVAEHIKVDNLSNNGHLRYMDASILIGSHDAVSREVGPKKELSFGHSHRQYVDWSLFDFLRQEKESAAYKPASGFSRSVGPQVYFIDEPEVGMSPKRHRELEKDLMDATIDNSILIMPTNSIVLYETDLPRIDLEHPEWGIFRPTEHPGYFDET